MATSEIDGNLLQEIEALATRLAGEAGRTLLAHFGQRLTVDFKEKGSRAPVTEVDRLAEEHLRAGIAARFPDHSIVGEEQAPLLCAAPFVWVLDPLDGTTNYINGLPFFAVSVGVLWRGRPVAGAICVSVAHSQGPGVYHARRGGGAYLDGERLPVAATPDQGRLAVLPARVRRALRRDDVLAWESRTLGSIAAEMAYVASGVFQYAYFGAPRAWDVAAGLVLLREMERAAYTLDTASGDAQAHRRRRWAPMEQFPCAALDDVQRWSAPVLAGEPAAVERVLGLLQQRSSPWGALTGWLRRWRDRHGKAHPGQRRGDKP
ncbi:MAG: inositol monophosphatase [Chloroflexi bacterium]|nr:inositol monophosphatase [Chloroflexota bacterium]